ncbi:MAG: 3-hydroxyacyl-CoA dehydrogenase/enoyl-CoA hydratase family protein [Planctomycetota bacterium]
MIVGVIGSGSIGPDLAYGFVSSLARTEGGKVFLLDIRKEALDAGVKRIQGYVSKAVAKGKLAPKAAAAIQEALVPTMEMKDLAACEYVLEAATEDLPIKQAILRQLEQVVSKDCLIGFATSGIPRARIAAGAQRPERCFVNHPFYPAWRALPIEIVPSPDAALSLRMTDTMKKLGKVPIVTADVPCFAADDIFCNYCAEAARIFEEGVATPAQVDKIVDDAIGGGGPFNVMDLTRGNLLGVHCMILMKEAPTGTEWFTPPPSLAKQGLTPWHDRAKPGDPAHDEALKREVLDRMLAVLLGRVYFVVDRGICDASDLDWLTQNALGFRQGLLSLAESLGAERVHDLCTRYAKRFKGFEVPESIQKKRLVAFLRTVTVTRDGDLAVVAIRRPEVKNALSAQVISDIEAAFQALGRDAGVRGVVLTSFDGAIAGADILELAALKSPEEAVAKCRRGQGVLDAIASFPKPVVAALDGPVMGGGAEISMACHARVVGPGLMMAQPEVNLGIIPGYGGTQRLPRLIGLERGLDLLRTGRPVGAKEACAWGWATGQPSPDFVGEAKALLRRHLSGEVLLAAVDPKPVPVPDTLPRVDIGHRSIAIDSILVDAVRKGLTRPLSEGLAVEAEGFGRCLDTVDMDIGMKNFIQNGPRVPATFLHE